MAAVNKDPFIYSARKDGKPHMFHGLVQAGGTQAIKRGELCTWNEATGYFKPVNAVADFRYPLALSAEEQKASGRHELTAIRYIEFYSLHPEDVFEFATAAAAALALGDPFTLTTSNSQKLTAGVGAFAVARCVRDSHYPQEEDTTIRNQSFAGVSFNPVASYWGFRYGTPGGNGGRRVLSTAVNLTLLEGDMYNTLVLVTSNKTITLPAVKPGMDLIVLGTAANAIVVDPDGNDKLRLSGALGADGAAVTSAAAAGAALHVLTESADGFTTLILGSTWS